MFSSKQFNKHSKGRRSDTAGVRFVNPLFFDASGDRIAAGAA